MSVTMPFSICQPVSKLEYQVLLDNQWVESYVLPATTVIRAVVCDARPIARLQPHHDFVAIETRIAVPEQEADAVQQMWLLQAQRDSGRFSFSGRGVDDVRRKPVLQVVRDRVTQEQRLNVLSRQYVHSLAEHENVFIWHYGENEQQKQKKKKSAKGTFNLWKTCKLGFAVAAENSKFKAGSMISSESQHTSAFFGGLALF